ncbi:MAG: hypothetical protein IH940_01845 [Acidobacteria bacterium]|nr:hypothetical protein [Acidobacteriota bacterium]
MRLTKPMAAGLRFLVGENAGQMLVLFLLVMTIVFVAGVIGVDAALWHSQRRTAQKDADAAAFAGGLELFVRTDAADITSRATAITYEWGERNGIDAPIFANSTPQVITGCWGSEPFDGKPDGVMVDLSAKGASLFSTIWSLATPDVGAHAKVCIGSPPDATGMLPFGIPIDTSPCFDADGRPKFGEECDVEVRAPDGSSGETGTLRLFNDGSLDCSASNVGDRIGTFIDETAFGAGCPDGVITIVTIGRVVMPHRRNHDALDARFTRQGLDLLDGFVHPVRYRNEGDTCTAGRVGCTELLEPAVVCARSCPRQLRVGDHARCEAGAEWW